MKHYSTVDVPATTRTFVHHKTCDLCAVKISKKPYEVSEVSVSYKHGNSYPECGSGAETSFDLCADCFKDKLAPWLISQGAKPTEEEWEF